MPISKYFHGHGGEVMKNMKSEYGPKKGESVFYATANKEGEKPAKDALRPVDMETRVAVAKHNAGITKSQDSSYGDLLSKHEKDISAVRKKWNAAPENSDARRKAEAEWEAMLDRHSNERRAEMKRGAKDASVIQPVPVATERTAIKAVPMPAGQRNQPSLAPVPVGDAPYTGAMNPKGAQLAPGTKVHNSKGAVGEVLAVENEEVKVRLPAGSVVRWPLAKTFRAADAKGKDAVTEFSSLKPGEKFTYKGVEYEKRSQSSARNLKTNLVETDFFGATPVEPKGSANDAELKPVPVDDSLQALNYAPKPAPGRPLLSITEPEDRAKMTGMPAGPMKYAPKREKDAEEFRNPESSIWSPFGDPDVPQALLNKYRALFDAYYAANGRARAASAKNRASTLAEAKTAYEKSCAAFEECRKASLKAKKGGGGRDAEEFKAGDEVEIMTGAYYGASGTVVALLSPNKNGGSYKVKVANGPTVYLWGTSLIKRVTAADSKYSTMNLVQLRAEYQKVYGFGSGSMTEQQIKTALEKVAQNNARPFDSVHAADSATATPADHLNRAVQFEIAGRRANALDSYRAAASGFRKANDRRNESVANEGILECQRRMANKTSEFYQHPKAGRAQACDTADKARRMALERTRAGEQVWVRGTQVLPGRARDEHEGFAKLEHSLAHKKGVTDPKAVAAAIGRKKYGAAGMARKAAAGRAKDMELRPVPVGA